MSEKLNRQKKADEKKMIVAQHREKQFLREPTVLTPDDVMELLTFLFHGEAAQRTLDRLIEERRKTLTTDSSENPLF